MATIETKPETSIFRSWGALGRVDANGRRIDYSVPIEPDSNPHRNGFHPIGVNGAGADIKSLTDEGIL